MKKTDTTTALNRLSEALSKHGVKLKRMQLLQAAAAAFGYRSSHDMAAADAAGDLHPPAARHVLTADVPGVGAMVYLQDPEGNVFGVTAESLDTQTGQAANWIVSPLGGLLDITKLREQRTVVRAATGPVNVMWGPEDATFHPTTTNLCREIEIPAFRDGSTQIDPNEPAFMTSACCEVATVTQEDLKALGLPYGDFEGEFYPLTNDEGQYIAEDLVDADDGLHGALIGYSVLYKNAKYFMPIIEIANGPGDGFPPRDQVLEDAKAYAARIEPKVAAMGGHVLMSTGQDDRVEVQLLVPVEAAMAVGDFNAWKKQLAWLMVDPELPGACKATNPARHQGREYAVEVSWIGEGEDGDYDPMDPNDVPLLRFDTRRLVDGAWEDVRDGSYCTQVAAYLGAKMAHELARLLVERIEAEGGAYPKRLMEGLSWTSDTEVQHAVRTRNRTDNAMTAFRVTYGHPERGTSIRLERQSDGGVRCMVNADMNCIGMMRGRDIHEVRAWLRTLPCNRDDAYGRPNPSYALAPTWNGVDAETIRWMLVDESESESTWYEPGEGYPFDYGFDFIHNMTV